VTPDFDLLLAEFPREVPIFPLVEGVLFPGAVLPLHIFEPRYRKMLGDALKSDRMIAMARLLQRGTDRIHEIVGVGHVIHHEALKDGRSTIALLGLSAGRAEEVASEEPYRRARIELLPDALDLQESDQQVLERVFAMTVPGRGTLDDLRTKLGEIIGPDRLAPALVNTCAQSAPIYPLHKQELLEERSVSARLAMLLNFLERPWQWN